MNLAYLDAGSGSLIIQALLAGFAGTVVAVKLGWRRIANRLRRRPAMEDAPIKEDTEARR
jgi:hypothetical protein